MTIILQLSPPNGIAFCPIQKAVLGNDLPLATPCEEAKEKNIRFEVLAFMIRCAIMAEMKFAAAILVFVLFAFFISWGIVELLKGAPWLLLASVAVFLGTFIKFGCRAH